MIAAIDTNVVVRFLLKDDERQYAAAESLLLEAEAAFVSNPVLCETYWVLRSAGGLSKAEALAGIRTFLRKVRPVHDADAVAAGLAHADRGGDFADGVIAFEAARSGAACLFTFDRGFARRADPAVCRVELLEA